MMALICTLATTSNAQFKGMIMAGAGCDIPTGTVSGYGMGDILKPTLNAEGSLIVQYLIKGEYGVEIGATLQNRHAKFYEFAHTYEKVSVTQVSVPINLLIRFDREKFYLTFGGSVIKNMAASLKINDHGQVSTNDDYINENGVRKASFGIDVNIGYDFHPHIGARISYEYQGEIFKHHNLTRTIYPGAAYVSIGVLF